MQNDGDNEIAIVKHEIFKTFHFLEKEYFYFPNSNEEVSSLFDNSVKVEYINKIRRREIAIRYTKGKFNGDVKFTFSVSIIRTPYVSFEDFFSLDIYLQSIGKHFSTGFVTNFNFHELQTILQKLANSLKEHAEKIIDGSIWLETYYPRKD